LVGKPEGKITVARYEYRHLTSAITALIKVNSIALWNSAVQKNSHLFYDPNNITIFTEPDCKPHKSSSQFLDSF
jgi:hypothetical protein